MRRLKLLSIVVPCLNERQNIIPLYKKIDRSLRKKYKYELIFVDDNSPDNTFDEIEKLGVRIRNVKGIKMYKRAGLQPSLVAGMAYARGQCVINMDADLQHPPELIPLLIKEWKKGYDAVLPMKEINASEPKIRKLLRGVGYFVWEKFTQGELSPNTSEYRLIDQRICKMITESSEKEIYVRGMVNLYSNKIKLVPYKVAPRLHGTSTFTISRLLGVFATGLTAFSTTPLRAPFLFLGVPVIGIFLFFIIFLFNFQLFEGNIDNTILFISFFQLSLFCMIFISLGIIGEYLKVMYKEIKQRKTYIIERTINL